MFSQEAVDLHDDGFEGSNDELCISQEVFYGNVGGCCSERVAADGANTNTNKGNMMAKTSICSQSENSAVTNQASSKNSCQDAAAAVQFRRDSSANCFMEGSTTGVAIDHTMQAKRMRLSMNELSDFKPYLEKAVTSSVPVKQVVSDIYHPTACQLLMCHVVESSREGLTSSCYLLKQYPESNKEGIVGDGSVPNGNLSGSDGSELKQLGVCKSVASPISQESSATKLLESTMSVPSVGDGVLHSAKRKHKRSVTPELEDDDVTLNSDGMMDSRSLRSQVLHLLERVGWSTEYRKRGNGRYRCLYRSPEGKLIREFRKVWNMCGQTLSAHGNCQLGGDGKHWTDVGQLWSDLYKTLRYIEDRMDNWDPMYALACQWNLLNPFVIVVLIDRKLHALRSGNLVRVKQGNAVDVGRIREANCNYRPVDGYDDRVTCNSSLMSDTAVITGDAWFKEEMETHKSRSIYVSEGNSLSLVKTIENNESPSLGTYTDENMHICSSHLPASVSDSTCLRCSGSLYNVPVGNAEVNMTYGQSEILSPRQDSCMSSPSCNKCNLDSFKENAKELPGSSSDADNVGCSTKSCTNLFEHQSGSQRSRFKCSHHNTYNSISVEKVNYNRKNTDEAIPILHNDSIEPQSWRKGMRPKKYNSSSKKRSKTCQLKDDDLLISAIIKKRNFKSSTNQSKAEPGMFKFKPLKKRKSQKGSCRLLPRSLGKGGKQFTERWCLVGERTVLSWLISVGAVSIDEVIQYRDQKDDTVVKEGIITRNGILCICCNEMFSVSGFKVHSGFMQNRPCLNLFMESGRPFTLCQLQAWSDEYKARRTINQCMPVDEFDKNDDSCGLCGDVGELLCCDNCPSTYHQSCLSAEELPEGNWYCMNCTCQLCEDLVDDKESSSSDGALKCSQCEQKYHQGCLQENGKAGVGGSPWFCGLTCEEVYGGLQSHIGLSNQIGDDYSWTLLRSIDDDQKFHSPQRFALKAECNSKLAVAVTVMEECFLSMTDARTGIDMIPQVVYNWGSEFARLNYHGFYAAILEKNDVLISVASIRVHGVVVAEMPLIATCSKYRRQGMCRRLLNSVEKMLISLKVEKLVIAAIPDLVETWTIGFGFIPMEEEEKKSMRKINLMVFPGTVMLKKILYVNQDTTLREGGHDVLRGLDDSIKTRLEGEVIKEPVSGNAEWVSPELSASHLEKAIGTLKDSEAAAMIESEPLDSMSVSECEDLQICGMKLNDNQNQHLIEDQSNLLKVPEVQEAVETVEIEVSTVEVSIEENQHSGDSDLTHDVTTLKKEVLVSSSEIMCINDDENQLSLIEQSQEASAFPQSKL